MKKILLLTITLLLINTTTTSANAEKFMDKALNTWIGYTLEDAINVWGYPTKEKIIAEKHLIYWTYREESIRHYSYYSSYGEKLYCSRVFEINNNKQIIGAKHEGNNCPINYVTGKKLVNPQNDPWKIEKQNKKILKEERKRLKQEAQLQNI